MTEKTNDPDGESRSPRGADIRMIDRRILARLASRHPSEIGFQPAENDPFAVAVFDHPESEAPRFYRNRPSVGQLEFRDSVTAAPIILANMAVFLTGDLDRLWDPRSTIRVVGLCDGDQATGREFSLSGPELIRLEWMRHEFGSSAWYQRDLPGHVLEGWIVCSVAQEMRRHGR